MFKGALKIHKDALHKSQIKRYTLLQNGILFFPSGKVDETKPQIVSWSTHVLTVRSHVYKSFILWLLCDTSNNNTLDTMLYNKVVIVSFVQCQLKKTTTQYSIGIYGQIGSQFSNCKCNLSSEMTYH